MCSLHELDVLKLSVMRRLLVVSLRAMRRRAEAETKLEKAVCASKRSLAKHQLHRAARLDADLHSRVEKREADLVANAVKMRVASPPCVLVALLTREDDELPLVFAVLSASLSPSPTATKRTASTRPTLFQRGAKQTIGGKTRRPAATTSTLFKPWPLSSST